MGDIDAIVAGLSEAQRRNLLALPKAEGIWMTISEMSDRGATGSGMDILCCIKHIAKLFGRRWVRWGSDRVNGQKRGEGYEYCILPNGLAVRAAILRGQ